MSARGSLAVRVAPHSRRGTYHQDSPNSSITSGLLRPSLRTEASKCAWVELRRMHESVMPFQHASFCDASCSDWCFIVYLE